MNIDLTVIPAVLDSLHIALALSIIVLLMMNGVLLTFGIIFLLRRRKPDTPIPITIERIPPDLHSRAFELPNVLRVSVEKVPNEMIPVIPSPAATSVSVKETAKTPDALVAATPDAALQLLSLLQKESRLIDFIKENISGYSDERVGAVARVVHDGCKKVLNHYFELEPIRKEEENTRLTLPKGYDASAIRVSGNVVGTPPFTGILTHRGWRASKVKLPKIAEGHDTTLLAPAEVEL